MQLSKVSLIALAVWPVVMVSAANKIELDPTAETYLAEGKIASCEDFNHETAQCYEYDYQPDQCVPLEYPDRTGDKLSGFIHTLAEVRCFLYADSKCDPSPGIGDAMYANSRFTWERDFKATAFKCMPEKESLDESAHVDTSDIDYCAERGEDAKCYTMAYKMGTCKPLEDPKATGDRFSIYTINKRGILCVLYEKKDCSDEGGEAMSHAPVLGGPLYTIDVSFSGYYKAINCVADLLCSQYAIDSGNMLCQ